MTRGEQAVWATEFVRHLGPNSSDSDLQRQSVRAAQRACSVVKALRRMSGKQLAFYESDSLDADARIMLDEMLSSGGDR